MVRQSVRLVMLAGFLAALGTLASCDNNDGPTGPGIDPSADCTKVQATILAPGRMAILDPAVTGPCVHLPAAGGTGAEYLLVAVSTSTEVRDGGMTGPYQLRAEIEVARPTR